MSMIMKVEAFNLIILGLIPPSKVQLLNADTLSLSLKQLREEIDEFEKAHKDGDLVGAIDALIDLDYFQKGVLFKMGISGFLYEKLFDVVHEANMSKRVGVNKHRDNPQGIPDAIKPTGWESPEDQMRRTLSDYTKIQND